MQDAATAGLESALHELSSSARRKFDTARILTDEVRALTYRRGAELTQEAVPDPGESGRVFVKVEGADFQPLSLPAYLIPSAPAAPPERA